ncbi:MAG: DUF4421 family protein, partial [Parafilimonas sp.]
MIKKYFVFINLFLLLHSYAFAQTFHDSLYYQTFPNNLTVRIYSVKDYTDFTFSSIDKKSNIKYRSNTTLNLGAGVTYKNVSGNLSAGFGFLNNGINTRGKTKSLDLQFHFFLQKFTSDLLYLHYKGFYAAPQGYASQLPSGYYFRPDIKLDLAGLSGYYVQNFRHFSYRTAFFQNELIRKSSGTLLYGGGIYYENIRSNDSSLIPAKVAGFFNNANFSQLHFVSFGPGIGYAYTALIKKNFFILGSAIINGNINFATDENTIINHHRTSFEPCVVFKSA